MVKGTKLLMFKNLHLKITALVLAMIFWIFVVSLENTFFQFPSGIDVQAFNLAEGLALASKPGQVALALRAQDQVNPKTLSAGDFEAYIDLRNVGAGKRKVPVSVTSKNPQISVVRIVPSEIEVEIEPVRERIVNILPEVVGEPANGFVVESIKLSQNSVKISGAESLLQKISTAKARAALDGNEKANSSKTVEIKAYDRNGIALEGLEIKQSGIEAFVSISQSEGAKQIGVKARLVGAVENGVVKKVEVDPGVVSVTGLRDALESTMAIETEAVDLKEFEIAPEKKVKLVLPQGLQLAKGQSAEVTVKVTIEKVLPAAPVVPTVSPAPTASENQ